MRRYSTKIQKVSDAVDCKTKIKCNCPVNNIIDANIFP